MNSKENISNANQFTDEESKKKKKEVDESELKINMNQWGFLFIFLFVGVISYIIISAFVYLPPFTYDIINDEYIINDLLLTILIISALIFLGLGIYFGWIKKPAEKKVLVESSINDDEKKDETIIFTNDISSDENKKSG